MKEICKNVVVFVLTQNYLFQNSVEKEDLDKNIEQAQKFEKEEHRLDLRITELEKELAEIKKQPTTQQVEDDVDFYKAQSNIIERDNEEIRLREDFLGDEKYQESQRLKN